MNNKYELRAVAFIDLLGFSNIVKDENNFDKIKNITKYLLTEQKVLNKGNAFEFTIFSDSIIISATFEYGKFFGFVNIIDCLLKELAMNGFLARGGISVGNLYHNGNIVFGPALLEAVNIEKNIALYPRVVLTKKSLDKGIEIDDNINDFEYREKFIKPLFKEFSKNKETYYYIDYLHDNGYIYSGGNDHLDFLKIIKNFIENAYANINDSHIIEKYDWLKDYLIITLREYKNLYHKKYEDL